MAVQFARNNCTSSVKMETAFILLVCMMAAVNAQLLNPISTMAMGSGLGHPMWHSGMRYPGMMQTSQLNSVTYPTWRTHPLFRMVSSDKNAPSDVTNVPKVLSTQEVLTHMALANQNREPYFDTISDFLYDPQKARAVLTPVASVASVSPLSSMSSVASMTPIVSKPYSDVASEYMNDYQKARAVWNSAASAAPLTSVSPVASMAPVASKPYADVAPEYLHEYQKARAVLTPVTATGSLASATPMYVQGMNLIRASANMDDCVQDGGKWERGMDWLY